VSVCRVLSKRPRRRDQGGEVKIKIDISEIGRKDESWMNLAQNRAQSRAFMLTVSGSAKRVRLVMDIIKLYLSVKNIIYVRFKILTAASMKMIVFWDLAPCGLVEIDLRFRGAYCLHHQEDD
jgi:hypothetical protein